MTRILSKLLALAAIAAAFAFAQNPITSTTLSGAVTSSQTVVCLASATSVITASISSPGSILMVDNEAMQVTSAGPTSTCFNVKRGLYANSASNGAKAHGNGAKVWVMSVTVSTGDTSRPISTSVFLSQRPYMPVTSMGTPNLFGATLGSVTDVAGKIWYSAMQLDYSSIATGACILNGATVGTDKWIVALYDNTGKLLANSTTAGTTTSGTNVYQCIAFGSPVALTSPAQYFLALQGNGTTDIFKSFVSAPTSYPTGSQTGTFGTLAAIATIPSTFSTLNAPVMTLY